MMHAIQYINIEIRQLLISCKPQATPQKAKRLLLPCVIVVLCIFGNSPANAQPNNQNHSRFYPSAVEQVLQMTTNRLELEKVINHYSTKADSLKRKAACFLIANMDIHSSNNYYWADSNNEKVAFNELDYPDFDSSLRAFEVLKKHTPKIHPIPISYKDMDYLKMGFLIDNIDQAFVLWKNPWAKELSFDDFCEYLLPYRIRTAI